jgi:hypothetical protein
MTTVNYYSAFILTDLDEPLKTNAQGAYELAHATLYKIRMINHHPRLRCDATVQVDGKEIGTYRINPQDMFTLERTSEVKKRLTFYKIDSYQGREAALDKDNPDLGKIKIIFSQEENLTARKLAFDEVDGSIALGGTGLSKTSTQSFIQVPDLPCKLRFTLNLILTLKKSSVEPLR